MFSISFPSTYHNQRSILLCDLFLRKPISSQNGGVIIFGSDQEVAGVMRAVRRNNCTGLFTWIGERRVERPIPGVRRERGSSGGHRVGAAPSQICQGIRRLLPITVRV
ncbi:hypothetical protein CEXT_249081 [Caerostris extrusa]|uniref:Uncharacterized protein n=1 Tax=Caerostris extrusa TaxID=172846 RepID=A0AAV4SJU8_CAEEX|nr:hypothetical protein CEXT_249081 [Caerostris extrusa]